jgi:hypothetical protein
VIAFRVSRREANAFKALAEVDRRKLNGLARSAAYMRQVVRRSMRERKSPSKPGQPPSARIDRNNGQPLRNLMVWGLDLAKGVDRATAVIGPLPLKGAKQNEAPRLHEFGGWMRNTLHRDLKVGSGAVIAVIAGPKRTRSVYDRRRLQRTSRWKTTTMKQVRVGPKPSDLATVVFKRLRTPREVWFAKGIQEDLWGPPMIRLPERSFLRANAKRIGPQLAREFEGAMRGRKGAPDVG